MRELPATRKTKHIERGRIESDVQSDAVQNVLQRQVRADPLPRIDQLLILPEYGPAHQRCNQHGSGLLRLGGKAQGLFAGIFRDPVHQHDKARPRMRSHLRAGTC